jgi:mannose-6-phosphate isomerase-like protein (cupin superfamily)
MAALVRRSFDEPDEVQEFPNIKVETVRIGDLDVKRLTVEPGWRWSEHVGPAVGSDSCELDHLIWAVISGRFCVEMDADGSREVFGPGDVGVIRPGHDAWVVGDEPVVGIDVQAAAR